MSTATRLAADLDLAPLPSEGGWFRRTSGEPDRSVILFLVGDGEFSALHRLTAAEDYRYLAGAPLRLLLLDDTGSREVVLDARRPAHRVEPGVWQGSSSDGDWTLVTTAVSPAFDWEMFELGERVALQHRWPAVAGRIAELSRPPA
ncbi:cupin domain-containing protein [Nakamurella deserti]|uniref:cupin domain-containing protein n=1 Tax=Nakamurella deserti TaxID=2164074 RepID=UPI000DBEAACE|nr:cupin domain-containing protein [Nakamurella deserti]